MAGSTAKLRLVLMFTITFGYFIVEILVGYMKNSNALVADSFHMLSDVAALIVAFWAVKMSPKKWSQNTFGWARAEVLGSLINSVFLIALCFSILVESVQRFVTPSEITKEDAYFILIVGALGLVINLIGLLLFHDVAHGHSHGGSGEHGHSHSHAHAHGHSHGHGHHSEEHAHMEGDKNPGNSKNSANSNAPAHSKEDHDTPPKLLFEDQDDHSKNSHSSIPPKIEEGAQKSKAHSMNMRGVFLHLLADALGSVIVIISAVVIIWSDWSGTVYIDPALSVCTVFLILNSVWPLLQESSRILLQTVPTHIQVKELQDRLINSVDGIVDVHEFHVWQLAGERVIATAHVRVKSLVDYMKVAEQAKDFFHNEGIHSTTIQAEFIDIEKEGGEKGGAWKDNTSCVLPCQSKDDCMEKTCCGPQEADEALKRKTNNNKK